MQNTLSVFVFWNEMWPVLWQICLCTTPHEIPGIFREPDSQPPVELIKQTLRSYSHREPTEDRPGGMHPKVTDCPGYEFL